MAVVGSAGAAAAAVVVAVILDLHVEHLVVGEVAARFQELLANVDADLRFL